MMLHIRSAGYPASTCQAVPVPIPKERKYLGTFVQHSRIAGHNMPLEDCRRAEGAKGASDRRLRGQSHSGEVTGKEVSAEHQHSEGQHQRGGVRDPLARLVLVKVAIVMRDAVVSLDTRMPTRSVCSALITSIFYLAH